MFSPFFLHCFCSFSVNPPSSFLFFCSFFLWVLLFFSVPLLSLLFLRVFAPFPPLFLLFFCQPTLLLFVFMFVVSFGFFYFFSIPLLSPLFLVFSPFFLLCYYSSFVNPPSSFLCSVPSLAFIAKECHAFSLTIKTLKTVITGVMVMVGDGRGICCFLVE
jgi:hypothetical protein